MTPTEIEQARRLVDAATPGPWVGHPELEPNGGCLARRIMTERTFVADVHLNDEDDAEGDANATFIAWAKNNLPALLDAYEAAVAENARLREGLDAIRYEAERDKGGLIHLKRCVAAQSKRLLGVRV